jgi:hypothetical protein
MRYMTILVLVVAFAGPVHGASNDPKAARQAGEPDTPRQGAEKAAQGIANPQVYWLDTAYRRSDGALVQEQRPFSSLAECEAEAKFRLNWRGGKDSPVFERADCRPTSITRKMLNDVRKDHCWDDPKRPAWERPQCRAAVQELSNILERELTAK